MTTNLDFSRSVDELAKTFGGQLLRPGDQGYDDARRVHNGLIDKHPALIARCFGTAGIVDAVNLGRQFGLEIAVRGGGHNVAGFATTNEGLMIDLALMKAVHVDHKSRKARVQGGATWAQFNRETQLHGLASTGGVISTTGVAGLTLGGGLGWLMPKFGMALDNLLSAEVVTADGKVLTASARENADLFWALRGGGGNFGVVSSFEFRVHKVGPVVTGGLVAHPFDKARDMLRFYRDVTASLPDEMMVFAGFTHAPDGSATKLAVILVCHIGNSKAAAAAVKPFKEFGTPVIDTVGPVPYATLNSVLDDGFPKGALNYWKSSFLNKFNDQAIDTMIACFDECPTPMGGMMLEHFHGAACRVRKNATAFPHRTLSHNLAVLGQWQSPADSEKCIAWTRRSYAALEPFMAARRYANYLGNDEGHDQIATAFGSNYAKLKKIKTKYDPGNLFRLNQNIRPAS